MIRRPVPARVFSFGTLIEGWEQVPRPKTNYNVRIFEFPDKKAPRRNRYPLKEPIGNRWRHFPVRLNMLCQMKTQEARAGIIVYGCQLAMVFERGYEGTWFREQRTREMRRIVEASGMTVVDQSSTGTARRVVNGRL